MLAKMKNHLKPFKLHFIFSEVEFLEWWIWNYLIFYFSFFFNSLWKSKASTYYVFFLQRIWFVRAYAWSSLQDVCSSFLGSTRIIPGKFYIFSSSWKIKCLNNFVYQNAFIRTLHTRFFTLNYLCEFKTREPKFKRWFCPWKPV